MTSCTSPGLSSVQEQRDKWERKRTRTSKELVQTEQKYCGKLRLITTYFVEILNAKGTLKTVVTESIFSSIKHIHTLNQSLLVHLENGYLGRGFDQFCPELHHYRVYVDNFYNAQRVLRTQLKKSKAFRRFKTLQESRAEFRGQSLEELLELPLTRVQQYRISLEALASNTRPQHPEFHQLSRALGALSELSDRVEENKRHHENLLQLQRVQRLLRGTRTKIISPGRWFLRQGPLKVVPPKGSEAKAQMFFLFSDVLLQTRHSALSLSGGERLELRRVFPLSDCSVDKVFGHTKSQGGLLSLSFPKAKLLLMSSDQEDFNDWFNLLTSAVRKLQSKPTEIHHKHIQQQTSVSSSAPQRKRAEPAVHWSEESSAPQRKRAEPAVHWSEESSAPQRKRAEPAAHWSEESSAPQRKRAALSPEAVNPQESAPQRWRAEPAAHRSEESAPQSVESSSSGCAIL